MRRRRRKRGRVASGLFVLFLHGVFVFGIRIVFDHDTNDRVLENPKGGSIISTWRFSLFQHEENLCEEMDPCGISLFRPRYKSRAVILKTTARVKNRNTAIPLSPPLYTHHEGSSHIVPSCCMYVIPSQHGRFLCNGTKSIFCWPTSSRNDKTCAYLAEDNPLLGLFLFLRDGVGVQFFPLSAEYHRIIILSVRKLP